MSKRNLSDSVIANYFGGMLQFAGEKFEKSTFSTVNVGERLFYS